MRNSTLVFNLMALGFAASMLAGCPGNNSAASSPANNPTDTFTPTPLSPASPTDTGTPTPTATVTATPTITNTPTITATSTASPTATASFSPTITFTPTQSATPTPTGTPTFTFTPTATYTAVYPYQQTIASGIIYSLSSGIAVADSGTGAVTLMVGNDFNQNIDLFTGTATGLFSHTSISAPVSVNSIGVAWNPVNSNFYVAEEPGGPGSFIQRFTASGGNPGGGGPVTFAFPTIYAGYVAVDAAGNVYVSDTGNFNITEFTAGGSPVATWGNYPSLSSLAYDAVNNQLVIVQSSGAAATLIHVNLDGSSPTTVTAPNYADAAAFDGEGNLFLALNTTSGNLIDKYTNGFVSLATFGAGGTGAGQLQNPNALAIDSQGYVYVSDPYGNHNIVEYAPH